ncbi:aspartate aminotransferase family protein, partial [Streptomyces sp. NPDC007808]
MSTPPSLASGPEGPPALRPLLDTVLDALTEGARARGGPLPSGGPEAVAARLRAAVGDVLPDRGDPNALHHLVRALAEGAADPADPLCTAHLHCPPLALATAADLAASALNPSLDSWDQAPGAAELEALVTDTLAREVFTPTPQPGALLDPSAPRGTATAPHEGPAPDTPASGVAAAMEACSLSDAAAPRAAADASQAGRPSDAPASGVAAAMEACSLSDAAAPRAAADASQAGR